MASAKKGSWAARRNQPQAFARLLEGFEGRNELVEHLEVQRVVHPAPLLTVLDDSGVLERSMVERQKRLASLQRPGEVADTVFAVEQTIDDLQARVVGQAMEAATRAHTGPHPRL